tara:strand:- start:1765 stop:1911 length:147 start_codon:yes stop_codon:yes gene_type:complete
MEFKNSGVFVLSSIERDVTALKCIHCLTVYNPDFEMLALGIPQQVGHA